MMKYLTFFKIRLKTGFQYRIAAIAGMTTNFFWGFMLLLMYKALYESSMNSIPMPYDKLSSYTWLVQGFLALVFIWSWDNDILNSIESGNIAYELCRPINLYSMWYAKILSSRLSITFMRAIPLFTIAFLLPEPYNLMLPDSFNRFLLFALSLSLGVSVLISCSIIVYSITIRTISSYGIRLFIAIAVDFLSGGVLPLPFWPDKIRFVAELLPFSAIMNVPFNIYIGNIGYDEVLYHMGLQIFWLIVLVTAGSYMLKRSIKHVIVQGG